MDAQELHMPHHHQIITNRFVQACQVDERVIAAFISGSYARGTTDIHSDLDFGLIITDEAYDDFFTGREAFIRLLGEPVFLEDYNGDGADFVFSWQEPTQAEQIETLRRLINWFWHNLTHHFITPIARGQLWSAYGALEDLRLTCVNLARLRQNFSAKAEGYEKVEQTVPVEQLVPLQTSFCLMERVAMLQAALTIVHFYQELAPPLAQAHGIPYPADLARVMSGRLELLSNAYLN